MAGGVFGGGVNSSVGSFSARSDWDIQVLRELQNLGFGNRARVRASDASASSLLELFRIQDRVAAEIVQAVAQAQTAASRMSEAESELRDALDSYGKNLEGLGQTKRAGNLLILVIRPQEVVAAIQALGQAYSDYYGTVADYNRAQFRLTARWGSRRSASSATTSSVRRTLRRASNRTRPRSTYRGWRSPTAGQPEPDLFSRAGAPSLFCSSPDSTREQPPRQVYS